MAELVDAPASGAGDRKVVEVRVLFWAPFPVKTGHRRRLASLIGGERRLSAFLVPVIGRSGRSIREMTLRKTGAANRELCCIYAVTSWPNRTSVSRSTRRLAEGAGQRGCAG